MKLLVSYGHDANAPLIEKIKEYLSKDADGNLKHEVWIDTSEIKAGKDWREKITKDVLEGHSRRGSQRKKLSSDFIP